MSFGCGTSSSGVGMGGGGTVPRNNQDTVYIISVLRTYNLNRSMTIKSHLAYNS